MVADRFGPHKRHVTRSGGFFGRNVEVVEYFDVITEKSDRGDNNVAIPCSVRVSDGVVNVWLQPRPRGASDLALVGQGVA